MADEITALDLAKGLQDIYDGFVESIHAMGNKMNGKKGRSKLAGSVVHWLAGSHVKTERDLVCEKFIQDVESQLQIFDLALEGIPEEEARTACEAAADILTAPFPANSNKSTDLMRRAMIGQVKPYLPRLSREKLIQIRDRLEETYTRSQRFPVENEVLKDVRELLKQKA